MRGLYAAARRYFAEQDPRFAIAFAPALLVSILLYVRSPLSNYIFDEQEALLANPYVNDPTVPFHAAFARDFWGLPPDRSIGSYRPLPNLIWRLLCLTFVRTSELIGATWDEFRDLDGAAPTWEIPAERMKMKAAHVVPLAPQVVAILRELQAIGGGSRFILPGRNLDKSISNNTLLFALYRMGFKGEMTGHGFRGVASTALHEMGMEHAHIELQLAHQERNRVSAAYNYAQYLPQRAKLMQTWADHLDGVRGEPIRLHAAHEAAVPTP